MGQVSRKKFANKKNNETDKDAHILPYAELWDGFNPYSSIILMKDYYSIQ